MMLMSVFGVFRKVVVQKGTSSNPLMVMMMMMMMFHSLIPLKFHLIKYMYMYHQKMNENQAASNEPRPKEVDGSNLIEPCDPNITDAI